MAEKNEKRFMTPMFRASFAHVFAPVAQQGSDVKKYKVVMLFKKGEDLSMVKAAIAAAVTEKWGDKAPKKLKYPVIKEQDELADKYEGFVEGAFYIQADNKQKPGLCDKNREEIIDEEEFYSGCYARATVEAYAWDNTFGKGVSLSLQNVQKLKDGERLGGGVRVTCQDDFDEVDVGDPDDIFS